MYAHTHQNTAAVSSRTQHWWGALSTLQQRRSLPKVQDKFLPSLTTRYSFPWHQPQRSSITLQTVSAPQAQRTFNPQKGKALCRADCDSDKLMEELSTKAGGKERTTSFNSRASPDRSGYSLHLHPWENAPEQQRERQAAEKRNRQPLNWGVLPKHYWLSCVITGIITTCHWEMVHSNWAAAVVLRGPEQWVMLYNVTTAAQAGSASSHSTSEILTKQITAFSNDPDKVLFNWIHSNTPNLNGNSYRRVRLHHATSQSLRAKDLQGKAERQAPPKPWAL